MILLVMLTSAVLIVVGLSRLPIQRPTKLVGICRNNLRSIDNAKQQWAVEQQKTTSDPPPTLDDLAALIGRGTNNHLMPECPCGGIYTPGRLDEPAKCSLSEAEHTYERKRAHERDENKANGAGLDQLTNR